MLLRTRLGMIGAAVLAPMPAYAAGAAAAILLPVLVFAVAAACLVLLAARHRARVRALDAETRRIAASLAASEAALAASPVALYRFDSDADGVCLGPGSLPFAAEGDGFASVLAALGEPNRVALESALGRLRLEGAGFALGVRLAAHDGSGLIRIVTECSRRPTPNNSRLWYPLPA